MDTVSVNLDKHYVNKHDLSSEGDHTGSHWSYVPNSVLKLYLYYHDSR